MSKSRQIALGAFEAADTATIPLSDLVSRSSPRHLAEFFMTVATQPSFYAPDKQLIVNHLDGDCLEREPILDRLTRLASRLEHGGVIGVDGRWGDGKSWVAKRWFLSLGVGATTAYLDAFAQDFEDDAFASIARALLEAVDKEPSASQATKVEIKTALVKVAAIGAKKGLRAIASTLTVGASDALIDAAIEGASEVANAAIDAGERALSASLEAAKHRQLALGNLKDALATFTNVSQRPLIVVVDELDRCRPDFALQMLDRLKHLFDLPKVVFVLFVNRKQLEASIASRHGHSSALGYLDKFVHFWVSLARVGEPGVPPSHAAHISLLHSFLQRLGQHEDAMLRAVIRPLAIISSSLNMSARELERAACLTASVERIDLLLEHFSGFGPWMLALKVHRPEVFDGLLRDRPEAHQEAAALASIACQGLRPGGFQRCLTQARAAHELLSNDPSTRVGPFPQEDEFPFSNGTHAAAVFVQLARWLNE